MTWVINKAFPGDPIDPPYKHYNRVVAADPVNTLVPLYAGERVIYSVEGKQFQALGPGPSTWVDCGCSGPE
jgi:hypothetical protein